MIRNLLVAAVLSLGASASLANVVGSDFQNFNPTSNGTDFVTVQSSETLQPLVLNLGLFLNYARNPLPVFDSAGKRLSGLQNQVMAYDFNLGIGLLNNWDIGINLPGVLFQKITDDNERIQFASKGLNEVRLNTKVRLVGDDTSGGVALVLTANKNLIEDNPYAGDSSGLTKAIELAADINLLGLALGINLGYRDRAPGDPIADIPVEPLDDQYLGSVAAAYFISPIDSTIIWEIYGSLPAKDEREEEER